MQRSVIIVAGGSGSRMNSGLPKQFLPVCGKPLLFYSLEAFRQAIPDIHIIVILPREHLETWNTLLHNHHFVIPHITAEGGKTRFNSVLNGLNMTKPEGLIGIHDGARPLVSIALIRSAYQWAEKTGAAIPAIPVNESMRMVEGTQNEPADRSKFRIIQTPQVFDGTILHQAYSVDYRDSFTDDATVVEQWGHPVTLFPGEPANIKITLPTDLLLAEALLKANSVSETEI